jgi:hypothetical protein
MSLGPHKTASLLKALGGALVGVGAISIGAPLWAGAAVGVGAWLYMTRDS